MRFIIFAYQTFCYKRDAERIIPDVSYISCEIWERMNSVTVCILSEAVWIKWADIFVTDYLTYSPVEVHALEPDWL